MSKSNPDSKTRILLSDTPEVIESKIKGAVTDSVKTITYDPVERPGVANLLDIYSGMDEEERSAEEIALLYADQNAGQLKKDLTELLVSRLESIRREYEKLREDPGHLHQVEQEGAGRAEWRAAETLSRVKEIIGL